jgi:hypothetical protein
MKNSNNTNQSSQNQNPQDKTSYLSSDFREYNGNNKVVATFYNAKAILPYEHSKSLSTSEIEQNMRWDSVCNRSKN